MTPREELEMLRREQQGRAAPSGPPALDPRAELEALRQQQQGQDQEAGKRAAFGSAVKSTVPILGPAINAATSPQAVESAQSILKGAAASSADIGRTLLKPVQAVIPEDTPYIGRRATDEAGAISRQWRQEGGTPAKVGGVAADLAGTGGVGTMVRAGGRVLPQVLQRFAANSPRAAAAAEATTAGGLTGAYLSPDDPGKGSAYGAAGGLGMQQLLSRIMPRVAQPINIRDTPGVQPMLDAGVPMTVGTGANPNTMTGRALRWLEESAASIPILGAGIKAQREAARRGWRDAPLRVTADELRVPVPAQRGGGAGGQGAADLIEQVRNDVGTRYDTMLQNRNFPMTQRFQHNINQAVQDPRLSMTPGDRSRAQGYVEANLFDRQVPPGQGNMPRTTPLADIFRSQSDVRAEGRLSGRSDNSSERAYGQALINSADEVYNAIQRRYPVTGRELNRMRQPMHNLYTLQDAAARAPLAGEFSPKDLHRVASRSGHQALQDWARMGDPLLTKDPSGTVSTLWRTSLLLGGPHALVGGAGSIPAGAALHLGLGTRTGQRMLTGQTARQLQLANWLHDPQVMEMLNRGGGVAGREIGEELYRRKQ